MENIFWAEAKKYNVLPLDATFATRLITPRPSITAGRNVFTYSGEFTGTPNGSRLSSFGRLHVRSVMILLTCPPPAAGSHRRNTILPGYAPELNPDDLGRITFGAQYEFIRREAFEGIGGAPSTDNNPTSRCPACSRLPCNLTDSSSSFQN
jgi:hypothetical protein